MWHELFLVFGCSEKKMVDGTFDLDRLLGAWKKTFNGGEINGDFHPMGSNL